MLANAIVSRFTYLGCDVEHDLLATVLLATINADACHEGNLLRSHPVLLFETSRGNTAAEHGDIDVLIHEAISNNNQTLQWPAKIRETAQNTQKDSPASPPRQFGRVNRITQ